MKTIKARVYMLPTEDFGCIYKRSSELTIHEPRLHKGEWTPQNLYITTDEEIRKGDWYYCTGSETVKKAHNKVQHYPRVFAKIIASTDPMLNFKPSIKDDGVRGLETDLPQLPKEFVKKYCKAGGIEDVLVEYATKLVEGTDLGNDCHYVKPDKPKLNPDNTIIIHPFKEKMYSRDEVIKIIQSFDGAKFASDHMEKEFDRDKWIEENL